MDLPWNVIGAFVLGLLMIINSVLMMMYSVTLLPARAREPVVKQLRLAGIVALSAWGLMTVAVYRLDRNCEIFAKSHAKEASWNAYQSSDNVFSRER